MDVLVSLGANAAYIYSASTLLYHHFERHHISGEYKPTYFFEGSSALITFVALGKCLEAQAKGRTSEALTKLMQLMPEEALLVELDVAGREVSERSVRAAMIQKGDVLKVSFGRSFDFDEFVYRQKTIVNQSMCAARRCCGGQNGAL